MARYTSLVAPAQHAMPEIIHQHGGSWARGRFTTSARDKGETSNKQSGVQSGSRLFRLDARERERRPDNRPYLERELLRVDILEQVRRLVVVRVGRRADCVLEEADGGVAVLVERLVVAAAAARVVGGKPGDVLRGELTDDLGRLEVDVPVLEAEGDRLARGFATRACRR